MTQSHQSVRASAIAEEHVLQIRSRTNRLFACLMLLQVGAAVAMASWMSPATWDGPTSSTHLNIYAAWTLGPLIAAWPIILSIFRPRWYGTQIITSIAQALFSGLLIHLSGGRIETHFHVFGSLAFLSFYRDWKTLIPATLVVAADHFWRGIFWPESVFGVLTSSPFRAFEHALWVVFIDIFLIHSCIRGRGDIQVMAVRQADLETHASRVEAIVEERTAELATSEAFLRSVLDSQDAHIAIINGCGDVIGSNAHWQTFWEANNGGSVDQRDANYLDVCDTATGECAEEAKEIAYSLRKVLSGNSDAEIVLYPCHSPTEKRWFRVRMTALRGDAPGAVVTHYNVTDEIKRLEEIERISGEVSRLALVAERTENAVVITDKQGSIEWVNEGFTRSTGYSLDEVVGRTPGSFLHGPETDPETVAVMRRGVRDGTGFEVEIVNYRKDGTPYWLSVEVTPVRDEAGNLEHFVAIERDITNEVQMRQRLSEEKVLLDTVIANLPFQIYWKNIHGFYEGCNDQFLAELGLSSRDELVGRIDSELAQIAAYEKQTTDQDASVLSSGESILHNELSWEDDDGSIRHIGISRVPLRDRAGAIIGLIGLNSDITDRRRLEGQLSQAQKLESIGQLAAGIAHEINTPAQYVGDNTRFMRDEFEGLLRVVDSYAAQLDTSGPQRSWEERSAEIKQTLEQVDYEFVREEIPKAIEQSLEGIDRITRIVRAMKDFSHPGSDEKQSADLNQAIESTVTVCSNRWKYAANLELDLDPSLPAVPCLLGELNQVVLNLVVNAADAIAEHAEDGTKGHIVVSTREEDGHAVITVCDDGPGMPGEVRSKVFDPFFTTKEVGKGTGQGLAISRDVVVQKHGGTIECDSEEGQGTTFTVRLPLTHQSSTKEAA